MYVALNIFVLHFPDNGVRCKKGGLAHCWGEKWPHLKKVAHFY
jgi:hypothetical protein